METGAGGGSGRLAVAALAVALAALPGVAVRANDCPTPPGNAWPTGDPGSISKVCTVTRLPCQTDAQCPDLIPPFPFPPVHQHCRLLTTVDGPYAGPACGEFVNAWSALRLEAGDWDHGHGLVWLDDTHVTADCDIDHDLTRLLVAWHLVRKVARYAEPFGLHPAILDPDDGLGPLDVDGSGHLRGAWSVFVADHETDEWEPDCGNDDTRGFNRSGPFVDNYLALTKSGMYRYPAISRAGTLVHETTHGDVGHEGDDTCNAGASCDTGLGRYNAQTMNVFFLYDAAAAYRLGEVGGETVRIGAPFLKPGSSVRHCRFVPEFSGYVRRQALNSANAKRDNHFRYSEAVSFPRWANDKEVDAATAAEWVCEECDPGDFVFDPNLCQQPPGVCNEVVNSLNAAANSAHRVDCEAYNDEVADLGFSPEAMALAKQHHPGYFPPCATTWDSDSLEAYCDAEKAAATTLADLDTCGWMEAYLAPAGSAERCRMEFCHERFEADGGAGWSVDGDPYGCLDHFCPPADETCSDAPSETSCRLLYLAAHGHPDYVLAACPGGGCRASRARCILDALEADPDAWEYPEPPPPQCAFLYGICQLASTLGGKVLVSLPELALEKAPGPGPVSHSANPALLLGQAAVALKTRSLEGAPDEELQQLWESMVATPEMVRALFELAPSRFAALFGQVGFEEWIGPEIARVAPRPIRPEELPAGARDDLERLEELIAAHPEGLGLPFGSLRSQREQIDDDGDGVPDWRDNCRGVANRDQADVDAGTDDDRSRPGVQHYGDACDADLDNDGIVAVSDFFAVLRPCLGARAPFAPACRAADLDGDGLVGPSDFFSRFRPALGSTPGPGITE